MNTAISDIDLAWLAGLFEGEGCIGLCHQGRPTLQIGMTDQDVVRRAHTVAGVGKVREKALLHRSGKRFWVWSVGRCDEAASLLELLLPMLGQRRSKRAREVLESYRNAPPPKRLRTHCIHGHPFSDKNTRWDRSRGFNARVCRVCAISRTLKHRRKQMVAAHASGVFTLSGADSN